MKAFLSLLLSMAAMLALVLPTAATAAGMPALRFDPASWDYGTIAVGTTASKTFALTNTGTAASAALTVSISGSGAAAFTKTADSCSATSLGPGKSCSITVVYSPSAAGATDLARLTASSKKPAATVSAALSGQGTPVSVNNPPIANDDFYQGVEDTTLLSSAVGPPVLANDIDPDNDPLMALLVSNPTNGILTLNPTGTFAYTPNPNFHGVDSFTYRASDGTLSSNVATVIIQVVSVNDAPVAVNDSYSLSEDTQLNVIAPGVLGNDSDVDGNTLSAILVTGPANGSLTLNADGSFTYTPNLNFHGTDAFTYRTSDGALASNVATVTINVVSVNDAPIAVFDAFQTAEGAFDTIFGNLLLNDSDADGDPLNVTDPCLDLNVNTAGVTGDVAAKLPGLATQLIDPSLLDGTPCLWGISTATGQTFVALTADGTLSDGPTTGSPFQGLETGDSLDFLSTYSVSDGMGAISTGTFLVQIVGAS